MGISKLTKVIQEHSKKGMRERQMPFYCNKRIAIDAPMSIYQFLIAIRTDGATLGTTESSTSHLVGMFYRTINIVESGIKPVFVFDGKAPISKVKELEKRGDKRILANKKYKEAKEEGDTIKMEMYDKRKTKISAEHVSDCKKLLNLMKIPVVEAPSEAEAYCALLVKSGRCGGAATEDMDALTFGAPLLLRNMTASKSKKLPIIEFNLQQILKDFGMSHSEFVDLCILLGCDFCDTVKGVGPKSAFSLIKEFGTIEKIIENKPTLAYPKDWNYKDARLIFSCLGEGEVEEISDIKWDEVNLEEIKAFLVGEHGFSEDRVVKAVERFMNSRNKGGQGTLDTFFNKK